MLRSPVEVTNNYKQESPPVGNRKRRTARGANYLSVTCPRGTPLPDREVPQVLGGGTWFLVRDTPVMTRGTPVPAGVDTPVLGYPGKDLGPVLGYPKKGPGDMTNGWKHYGMEMGYLPPPKKKSVDGQTKWKHYLPSYFVIGLQIFLLHHLSHHWTATRVRRLLVLNTD